MKYCLAVFAFCLICVHLWSATAKSTAAVEDVYTVKAADTPPPNELGALDSRPARWPGDQRLRPQGQLLCTVWPRKEWASSASAEQIKDGLTYRELDETAIVGAVRFPEDWYDYRKQKVKPGVYTLRLGFQPVDGDHQGTAPFGEFCLLVPAKRDEKPDTMNPVELHQLSGAASGGTHPGVMLLFPNPKPAVAPAVESKPNETWVLDFQRPVSRGRHEDDARIRLSGRWPHDCGMSKRWSLVTLRRSARTLLRSVANPFSQAAPLAGVEHRTSLRRAVRTNCRTVRR